MHEPADIGGQLLRFRARKHHAVVERVQKAPLRDPAAALDQLLVHDRNLAGWTAKADETELEPEAQRLAKIDRARRCRALRCVRRRAHGARSTTRLMSTAAAASSAVRIPTRRFDCALASWPPAVHG